MPSDIPVSYTQLQDWLLARRVIPQDFARLLTGVDVKLEEALAEPVQCAEAKALIAEQRDITYFRVCEIYDAVARSSEGSKTLLGGHTHPCAAKWKSVVNAFRHRNLGWANATKVLVHQLTFEIPALIKQQTASEKLLVDCEQRITESVSAEAKATNRYAAVLAENSLEGHDVQKELLAHAMSMLEVFHNECAEVLQASGKDMIEYYSAFTEYVMGKPVPDLLPMLSVAAHFGNVSLSHLKEEAPAAWARRQALPARPVRTAAGGEAVTTGIDWLAGAPPETELVEDQSSKSKDRLLSDAGTRELLLRDVVEVGTFLRVRAEGGDEPECARKSEEDVRLLVRAIDRLEELLMGQEAQRFLLMCSSAKFLDQEVRRIQSAQAQILKAGQRRRQYEELRPTYKDEASQAREELERVRTSVRVLQTKLEAEMAAHFKTKILITGVA